MKLSPSEYLPTEEESSDTEARFKPPELPAIVDASCLAANPSPRPPELIYGLLHRGSKLVFGGGSKSYKTWGLIDCALSISHGEPFLGLKTAKGKVLYL